MNSCRPNLADGRESVYSEESIPMPVNTNAFYDVVLQGDYVGTAVINILKYRLAGDLLPGDLNLAGADTLAGAVKDVVWPAMRGLMSSNYTLQGVKVIARNAQFSPIYQSPFVLPVNEAGTEAAGTYNGPMPCVILAANIEPTSVLNDFHPPRRGYIAIGPVSDQNCLNDGRLGAGAIAAYQALGNTLGTNLVTILPPAVFWPIRTSEVKALGGLVTLRGWADVTGFTARPVVSFRRSRKPEA